MLFAKVAKAQGLVTNPVRAPLIKFMEKYPVHPPNGRAELRAFARRTRGDLVATVEW
jgi:hypothetical protein